MPTSTYQALLLTDVVDSTALTARLGDAAMSALWTAHDAAARDLLRRWRGREIDRSDGFLLTFGCAADAAGFALGYHRALAALATPMRARAGIHIGPVIERPNRDADVALGSKPLEIDGLAKPVVARVMSLAMAGQTLLTAAARSNLGETPWRLMNHGHWRAKGLDSSMETLELFEVGEAGAPFQPPPDSEKCYRVVRSGDLWLPARAIRHSLPAERTPFVGRQEALQDLAQRLHGRARLVSVLGIGGMGKTRLAQRFGWTWLGDFPGGAWFCDLSQATSLDGVLHAVAQGLDMPLAGADALVQIGRAIAGRRRCLVILDNFEQVARLAEQTLGRWLDGAPEARFLVTTREVLGIPGEETLALAELPPAEAAGLFLQRAHAARSGFQPTAEDREAVGPLVQLLDRLPLAIELAAARVAVMPPRLLLQRIGERFKLLAPHGVTPGRHATLRAAFDWSWDLLSLADKTALAQLTVFEGGFDLAAAEAVLDLSACGAAPWTVDVVQSLVQKSLLRCVTDHRFDLLGTVQEYAAEHLAAEGRFPGSGAHARAAAHERHWRHFAALEWQRAIADAGAETDNLVVACRRAADGGAARDAVDCLLGAWAVLQLRGPMRVAVELAAAIGAMPGLDAAGQAATEWVAGNALYLMGQTAESRHHLERGLQLARLAGDRRIETRILLVLSEPLSAGSMMEESRACLERALVLAQEAGDRRLECHALNMLGAWFDDQSMLDEAKAHYEAALALSRILADQRMEGGLLGNLGGLHLEQGRLDAARQSYAQALHLAQQVGDRRWEGNACCNLGLLDHEQGRSAEARRHFESALAIARELGHARLEATVQCNLGLVLEAGGDRDAAGECYERAVLIAHELGHRRSEGQFRIYLGRLLARQNRFAAAGECLQAGERLLEALADRVTLALLRCSQAELAHLKGNDGEAAHRLSQARQLADELGAAAASELGRAMAEVQGLLRPTDGQERAGP